MPTNIENLGSIAGVNGATSNVSVGIGTTSPRGIFDVKTNGDIFLANDPINGTAQSLYLPGQVFLAPWDGTNVSYLQAIRQDNSGSTELQIRTWNSGAITDAVRIKSNGNVGIGTDLPWGKVHVKGDVSGPGTNSSSYPLVVEGPDQGILIKINHDIINGTNNFRN